MDSWATVASDFTFGAKILLGKRNKVLKGRGKKKVSCSSRSHVKAFLSHSLRQESLSFLAPETSAPMRI